MLETFLKCLKGPQAPENSSWSWRVLLKGTGGRRPRSVHKHYLVPPSLAKAATNHGSLCSSSQVAVGWTQAGDDLGLLRSPSQGARNPHTYGQLSVRQSPANQSAPEMTLPRGALGRHRSSTNQILLCGVSPHNSLATTVKASPRSQPA